MLQKKNHILKNLNLTIRQSMIFLIISSWKHKFFNWVKYCEYPKLWEYRVVIFSQLIYILTLVLLCWEFKIVRNFFLARLTTFFGVFIFVTIVYIICWLFKVSYLLRIPNIYHLAENSLIFCIIDLFFFMGVLSAFHLIFKFVSYWNGNKVSKSNYKLIIIFIGFGFLFFQIFNFSILYFKLWGVFINTMLVRGGRVEFCRLYVEFSKKLVSNYFGVYPSELFICMDGTIIIVPHLW